SADIHLLNAQQDGLQQIAAALENRTDITALHLITHGAPGQLFLGHSAVDREMLRNARTEMEAISNAIAEDGELLIYGCEVAAGREGRLFVDALTDMTGLKVAAATHKVGAAELGGSWQLNAGMPVAQTLRVAEWGHVLVDAPPAACASNPAFPQREPSMTTAKFHFISGLPRSGSTLLAALLRQNPRFDASMTSGLGSLVSGAMQIMSPGSEVALTLKDGQREDILRGLFASYYQRSTEREVIFDTNRIWTARMPLLAGLFPQAKVIACVRDVSWVMDSLERRVRANPYHFTRLFGPKNQGTVYSRVETLMHHDALVGRAWTGLKEAYYGEQSATLLVVDYELLSSAPHKVLPLIYQFLEEPWFESHDFDNVQFDAPEFDEALGIDGLHRVRPKVEYQARKTILPPDLFQKFQGMDFWSELTGSRAHVISAQRASEAKATATA
ncbi:MAG: DUF4347 domain-containing protein, partial [Methylobacter sp.]|nr:DUF4347 domain-containing protein [Methylobacter sp.]